MTITTSITLLVSMIILALMPGPGILAVVARTLAGGLRHGGSAAAGIVAGDYVFITIALLGLATLAEFMGGFFAVLKYAGAGYLVYLGISLVFSKSGDVQAHRVNKSSHLSSFAAGLFTTLGNPKAILFYLSFFPAFLDLSRVSVADVWALYAIATVAVGGVMYGYAYVAHKARSSFQMSQRTSLLRYGSGALLVSSGVFVATRG